jgi:hypothetical protein
VYVLPPPVMPYANMQHLYPSTTDATTCSTSSNMPAWPMSGPTTRSKANGRHALATGQGREWGTQDNDRKLMQYSLRSNDDIEPASLTSY